MRPEISIIVPFFNEEENVAPLLREIRAGCDSLGSLHEAIFVNDGSRDATGQHLDEVARGWPEAKAFHFQANHSQASALFFGLKQAADEILIALGGDGQNDPADITKLLAELSDCDMVAGIRPRRQESCLDSVRVRLSHPLFSSPRPLAAAFSVAGAPRNPKKPVVEV
jgi:glycosyltransferase involved in cell wall biosynthesis